MSADDIARRDAIDQLVAELRVERREIERRLHVARVEGILRRQAAERAARLAEKVRGMSPDEVAASRARTAARVEARNRDPNPPPFNERAERDDTKESA